MSKSTPADCGQPLRELHGKQLYGYSIGILGLFLPTTLISAYLSMFYIYTVGLDAFLVSIGTALGAITNAVCAPLFGYLSDKRKPNKWGKRRPFLIMGLPLLFLSLVLLWTPPLAEKGEPWNYTAAIYLWVFNAAFFMNFALMRSPYAAMLPDISQVEKNRVKISGIQGIFSILSSVIGIILPMIIQSSLKDPTNVFHTTEDGQFLLWIMPWIGFGFGLLSIVVMLLTFLSVDESFYTKNIDQTTASNLEKASLLGVFKNTFTPLQDKNYVKFFWSAICLNMSLRMILRVLAPLLTYVLLLQGNEFLYFTICIIPSAIFGFIYWQKKTKEIGLKRTYMISTIIISLTLISTFVLLIPMMKITRIILAFFLVSFVLYSLVTGYFIPNPMISRLVDNRPENLKTGEYANMAGSYFGLYLFSLNISNALGDLLIGAIMTGNNATNPIILTSVLPISGFVYLLAVIFIRNLPMEKISNCN